MAFVEDLDVFINDDTPGYVNAVVNGATIIGLFDNAYTGIDLVGSSDPTLLCKSSDVPAIADGLSVTINSTAYKVAGAPEPDGHGLVLLQLRKSS